ncbi:MAG: flagellar M-ring protein FliF [Planctomycetaceae bacterium]|nr:flagellar M-ring protein FliF [Planctomycetaceae bacterium]
MALLNTLRDQLTSLWGRWSGAQRFGISAAALLCLAVMIGTFVWATQPDYVILADKLPPGKAAEMVTALNAEHIDVSLGYSGSSIFVPRGDYSRARLAVSDLLEPGDLESERAGAGFITTPRQEEDRRQRELEQRLARSIMEMRGVRKATIHVSRPDPSPFVIESSPVTASVVIETQPGGMFTMSTANTIASMVSRAVEGLTLENVSVVDTAGREYSTGDGIKSAMSTQLEYKLQLERYLAEKAESMLALSLGPGRAAVEIAADVDFNEKTRKEYSYDPEMKVKIQETTASIQNNGAMPLPVGPPGASLNTAPGVADSTLRGMSYKQETNQADYANGLIDETTRSIPGKIQRLTVSAIVDLTPPEGADPSAATTMLTVEQAEQIVRNAVGFDAIRGDEVSVISAPLTGVPVFNDEPLAVPFWVQYESLIQSAALGLSAFVAFVIGLLVVRKMKPVVMAAPLEEPMSMSDIHRLRTISEQARENPELVAKILAAWVEESKSEATDARTAPGTRASPPPRRRAA